jgi:CubicO group peptidase (beta-lactamase class C family)
VTATSGWVAPGFEDVKDAFQANFDDGAEVGSAFAAYHRGQKVVDLWGGIADDTTGRPWEEDTLVLVYSTTKGITAMCANRLAQDGSLDVEAPVATYWPEFAQADKGEITVADLLAHRAGLAWTDGTMSVEDMLAWDPVIKALEGQAPSWPPGTAHGYHATTYGWLVGEVVRRVTGVSIGTFLRNEIAGPLGAEFFIGLPPSEEPRVARLIPFSLGPISGGPPGNHTRSGDDRNAVGGPDLSHLADAALNYLAPDGPLFKALMAPGGAFSDPELWHSPRLHAAEIPAANGICDARSLARLMAPVSATYPPIQAGDSGPWRLSRSNGRCAPRRWAPMSSFSAWTSSGDWGSTSTVDSSPPPIWVVRMPSDTSAWEGRSGGRTPPWSWRWDT